MIELSKTAMVLAAGLGKRLGELTKYTPKPLVAIGDTCCLEIAITSLKKAGFSRIIVNTHYLTDQIETYVKRFNDIEIILSYEPELLETAGGIRKVLNEFGNKPFAVVNADIYWQDHSQSIIQQMAEIMLDSDEFCLSVTPLNNAKAYSGHGDFTFASNGLLQKQFNCEPYVYTGIQLINPRVIQNLPIAPLSLATLYANAANNIRGFKFNGVWVDIGNYKGLELAREMQHKKSTKLITFTDLDCFDIPS